MYEGPSIVCATMRGCESIACRRIREARRTRGKYAKPLLFCMFQARSKKNVYCITKTTSTKTFRNASEKKPQVHQKYALVTVDKGTRKEHYEQPESTQNGNLKPLQRQARTLEKAICNPEACKITEMPGKPVAEEWDFGLWTVPLERRRHSLLRETHRAVCTCIHTCPRTTAHTQTHRRTYHNFKEGDKTQATKSKTGSK